MVTTGYDGANRPFTTTGMLAGQQTGYNAQTGYAAQGAVASYAYGNGMVPVFAYNNRLQAKEIDATIGNDPNRYLLSLTYDWGTARNNGTLQGGSEGYGAAVPYSALSWFNQAYMYDGVNRLNSVSDTDYSRAFCSDAFGNIWVTGYTGIIPAGNTPQMIGSVCPGGSAPYDANNRINGGRYDAAGNQTLVNGNALLYDAENRLISETDSVTQGMETLAYDGEGRRVSKTNPGGTTIYVHDALGQLAAEYWTATHTPACTTCYLVWDHLGSTRLVTDSAAGVISRHDYLPFGEEIAGGSGGRGNGWGSTTDVTQKFTGKERDQEMQLDYFGARYYGAALGRFTSPDPGGLGASMRDPQSWNMYAYAWNNPLANVDPFGLDCITVSNASSSGVTVTTERGGSADTCSGTFVSGTVDVNSYSYNGSTLSWSDNSEWAGGALNLVFGSTNSSNSDWGPGSNNLLGARQIGETAPIGDALLGATLLFIQGPGSLALEGPPVMSLGMLGGKIIPSAAPVEPSTPVGRGNITEWNTTGSNTARTINGRYYTGHALDEMQAQGLTPSVVEETIAHGTMSPGNQPGTWKYSTGEASVVVNRGGNVITTHLGGR